MILTTYRYLLNREQMEFLEKVKQESGVPFSKQLDYAIELLKSEYDWNRDDFFHNLRAYVKGISSASKRRRAEDR